jgi:hypothetical protein
MYRQNRRIAVIGNAVMGGTTAFIIVWNVCE